MKYFKLSLSDSGKAQSEVWRRQEATGLKLSMFHTSGSLEVSTWTEDRIGEMMFRTVLKEMKIEHEEGDEQQVTTFLDKYFSVDKREEAYQIRLTRLQYCRKL